MNVCVVVFSPTGNTLKVAQMLQECLRENDARVQLLDTTRRHDLFRERGFARFLRSEVEPHDVLCVGGPVYAHHMQYNVLDLVKALPRPSPGWGAYAVPFVTYGTISSGVALAETARLLRKSGRNPALVMKVDARHCYSEILGTDVNPGKPGEEARPHINELSERILRLPADPDTADANGLSDFRYLDRSHRIKARLLIREKLFQQLIYPKVEIRSALCTGCGLCVGVCPVQRLGIREGKVRAVDDGPACIHCGSCVTACPDHAITFGGDLTRWAQMFQQAAAGKGFIASNEVPKSAVYPIRVEATEA
jgi:ferredoxin/flavodoxin